MEFLKKLRAGFFISMAAVVLAVIALFIYIANGNNAYYNDLNSVVVTITIITIIVEIILIIVTSIVGEKHFLDIFYVVVPALLGIAVLLFISSRVQSAGIILGSDLEKGNLIASKALNQAFKGVIFYFLAMIASMIGSFLRQSEAA